MHLFRDSEIHRAKPGAGILQCEDLPAYFTVVMKGFLPLFCRPWLCIMNEELKEMAQWKEGQYFPCWVSSHGLSHIYRAFCFLLEEPEESSALYGDKSLFFSFLKTDKH